MVASVGPYALKKLLAVAQRDTVSAGQASPATTIVSNWGNASVGREASADGGTVMAVMCWSCNNWIRAGPGKRSSFFPRQRVAPLLNDIKVSKTEASKLKEAN
jgi:hypothetical protein